MPELDYAAILQAGRGLVPDLQQQMLARQQFDLNKQQIQSNIEQRQISIANARQQQSRQTEFQQAVTEATNSGHPQDIARLMVRFPEFADKIKPGFEALNEVDQRQTLTQMGGVYARGSSGDYEGAAAMLEARHKADVAAGHADEDSPALIEALRSGDPMKQKQAMATVGMTIASLDPKKFSETYGKLFPNQEPSAFQKEYEFKAKTFGKAAADSWAAIEGDKFIPVNGIGLYRGSQFYGSPTGAADAPVQQPKGGGQASTAGVPGGFADPLRGAGGNPVSGGQYAAGRDYGAHQGVDYTGHIGTPIYPGAGAGVAHVSSSKLGGNIVTIDHGGGVVTKYMHLDGVNVKNGQRVAPDTVIGTLGQTGRATGPNLHYEVTVGGKHVNPAALHAGGVRRVRSVQEAMKLPKGTEFITPDGRHLRVP